MPDEQIERVLEEARQAFTVSEVMRPILAYQRMFERLGPQDGPGGGAGRVCDAAASR